MADNTTTDQPELTGDDEQPVTVPAAAPGTNKGSGHFAVWDHDLGQFVSGVSDKAGAGKSLKALKGHNGAITDGHKLEVLEV